MDFRYETKESDRDFHKKRVAFLIINNELIRENKRWKK